MKTLIRLFVLLLLLVGWGLAALSLHVVRTPDQIPFTLVPKDELGVTDTYVDTREWTVDELAGHEALVQKLIRSGKADALKHVASGKERKSSDVAAQLSDALRHSPRKDSTSKAAQPLSTEQVARGLLSRLLG